MTATEARKNFYMMIASAERPGAPVVITLGGLPKVIMMSFDEFEGWQETMEILSDPVLSKRLISTLKQIKKGKKLDTMDFDVFKKSLKL